MTIDHRCRISGDGPTVNGSGGPLEVNTDDTLYCDIESYGDVTLRDRSIVNGNIVTAGYVDRINNPVVNGYIREEMIVEPHTIPISSVTPGSTDRTAYSGQTPDLSPGNFRDIVIHGNSTLILHNGTYQFRKIIAYAGALIRLDAPGGEITVRVAEEMNLGDRTIMEPVSGYLNPLAIQWYSNQSSTVYLGTVCQLIGVFTAPNAGIRIGSRTVLKGRVFAEDITLDPDVKVESINDTRYADSDFDDVPDIVETAMGTNPYNGNSRPAVAQPSSWYGDASREVVVHYDFTMFPGFFYHSDVQVTIPAGVNSRAYNPVICAIPEEDAGVPLSIPDTNRLLAVYNLEVGITTSSSLLFGFPLPGAGIDVEYTNKDNLLLQHYNSGTSSWETVTIDHLDGNIAYAYITSASPYTISVARVMNGARGLDTLNNLRICVSDNPATSLLEKGWGGQPDVDIADEERLLATAYSLDLYRTVLPQLRYRFVDNLTGVDRANIHMHWNEDIAAFQGNSCYTASAWVDARDLLRGHDFLVSYPYTRMQVRMQNRAGTQYRTNNWYDVRYRMLETDYDHTDNSPGNNPERFFVMGLDSVMVSLVAGSPGVSGDVDGPGLSARLDQPCALFIDDTNGDVYFGVNAKIKILSAQGVVSTFAGTGVPGYANGPRLNAQFAGVFNAPFCRDAAGNIYVCERDVNRIRRIDAAGMVTLFAGSELGDAGYLNGNGAAARFNHPSSMCVDAAGNVYVADLNNHVIRRITPAGDVTTFAGTGAAGNVDGTVAAAQFNQPCGIAIDPATGNLFVSERLNYCVRFIDMSAVPQMVSRFAGDGVSGFADGEALTARFGVPSDLFVDARGTVYVADASNNAIRKIHNGFVSTLAGRPGDPVLFRDGCGTDARFNEPNDVIADTKGNLFVTEAFNHTLRKISTHVPLAVNAPHIGARLEEEHDEVWFDILITENLNHTISVNHDQLLSDLNATLFGHYNDYHLVETDDDGGNALIAQVLAAGRYLLRVHTFTGAARSNGAFSVQITNDRQTVAVPAAGNSTTVQGNLEHEGDNDWFLIDATTPMELTIQTTNRSAGLTTEPVLYMYRNVEGVPVEVPRVSGDDVHARIPLWRRVLRDGLTQINSIEFDFLANTAPDNKLNEIDLYWIRVRAGIPSETGTYELQVTRN